tara:strand:- start:844 stop:1164 length:321 start_codon:yes stop_codon:yes gene_type:complete
MDDEYRPSGSGFAAPVKVGDEIDVTIEAVGEKGDGLAKKDGFVLFVPNTQAGETVKVKITRVLQKVGFAEVVGKAAPQEGQAERPEVAPEPVEEIEDSEDFGEEED